MVKKFLLLVILSIISFHGYADIYTEDAFLILCNADILYMINKEQVLAFVIILENENAEDIFIDLLERSRSGTGKFYALLGIFNINFNRYIEIKETIDLSEEVMRQIFDINISTLNIRTLAQLIVSIENGSWIRNVKSVFEIPNTVIWQNL